MYGSSNITALPAAGTGAALIAASNGQSDAMTITIVLLAAWTALAAAKAFLRLTPKSEM